MTGYHNIYALLYGLLVLSSGCAVLYYMLNAQLFLQAHLYLTETTVSPNLCCNNGNLISMD
jgi:hypothetical protein